MKRFLLILVACALANALVPRDRRSLPDVSDPKAASTEKPRTICASQTPCAWSVYEPVSKNVQINIVNNYCDCATDMECVLTEDEVSATLLVFKCRAPAEHPS